MAVVERTRKEEVKLGMTLLGLIFSSILYGITLTQAYKYFLRFRRDPVIVKVLVLSVCLLDTVSVCLVGHAVWYYLITTGPIGIAVWSLNAELALSMAISGIAEMFLAYRVWMLSGHKLWLTLLLSSLALLHFASGEVSAIQFLLLKRFARFGSVKVPSILRLSSAALCDTGLAVSLCYFLRQKRTGFKKTDEMIDYMVLFSINSGILTSVASIACLITYLVVPKLWVYLALCFVISRLYANTFLCCLNSRQILRPANPSAEISSPTPRFRPKRLIGTLNSISQNTEKRLLSQTPRQIDVYVVTETITDGHQFERDGSTPSIKSSSRQTEGTSSSSSLGESVRRD